MKLLQQLSLVALFCLPIPLLGAAETRTYKKVAERGLKLSVEKPADWKASNKLPAIVFFFGGGWVGGTPTQFQKQSDYLATRGLDDAPDDLKISCKPNALVLFNPVFKAQTAP